MNVMRSVSPINNKLLISYTRGQRKNNITWARVTISPRTAYSHFKTWQKRKFRAEHMEEHVIQKKFTREKCKDMQKTHF